MNSFTTLALTFVAALLLSMPGQGGSNHSDPNDHNEHDDRDNHAAISRESSTEISEKMQTLSGLETGTAGARTLNVSETLFGVISAPRNQVFHIHAPYSGLIQEVLALEGERVVEGQPLLTVRNSATLQDYTITSPSAGEVTAQAVNVGDLADKGALLEITDLSQVWVEMSAFPENIEKLAVDQTVDVYDLHEHDRARGKIIYVAPQMTGGHIARARALIDNSSGHWRPGMHIKADVSVSRRQVNVAVRQSALQTLDDETVVFVRQGNTFTAAHVTLGERDADYVEVLGGLSQGAEYVTENSFLIKADVLKDAAKHDH
jgi:cobalt-zinc-cadmium efflux system membrane fusion protein